MFTTIARIYNKSLSLFQLLLFTIIVHGNDNTRRTK